MREAVQKTSELTQSLTEMDAEKRDLEAKVESLQSELSEKTQQYSTNEDNLMRDID